MTKRQSQVIQAIIRYQQERGRSPSLREIGKMIGLRSESQVHHHVNRLKMLGFLAFTKFEQKRSLQVLYPVDCVIRPKFPDDLIWWMVDGNFQLGPVGRERLVNV